MGSQKIKYSYRDCWNYALLEQKNISLQKIKNDLITLCQAEPENFWLNFRNKMLTAPDYFQICGNLDRYWKENCPVPYLINKVSFYGLSFHIEKGVFIPQKDTEILIEKTQELANKIWNPKEKLKILDIGTGCGNIAISLAKNKPKWDFTAIDNQEQALKISRLNAINYQIENIRFIQSNLFNNLDLKKKFNIIVSNPPYISSEEYANLPPLTCQQPPGALLAENNGYYFYQEIFRQVRNFLTEKFLLVVEIGYQQKEKVVKLIIEQFPNAEVSIFPDLKGYSRAIAVYTIYKRSGSSVVRAAA